MQKIFEAKKHFAARYLSEESFIGIGIGLHENTDVLRVYVDVRIAPSRSNSKMIPLMKGFLSSSKLRERRALPA